MTAPSSPLLILGGRSMVAGYVIERLIGSGRNILVASRRNMFLPTGMDSLKLDLERPGDWHAPEGITVISLLPLWVLAQHLDLFKEAKAVIALGSTSRFGKASSDDPHEQEVVKKLEDGEDKLFAWAARTGVAVTILRPTLIYDGIADHNITRLMRMIRRLGFVPLAAPAKGLRQPIHGDDVAAAILGAIDNEAAQGRALNIAGGEVLTYRAMVERIFTDMGKTPRLILLPVWLLKVGFRLLTLVGVLHERHFGFAVFARMNEDLIFDVQAGLDILGYQPRKFVVTERDAGT